MSPTLDSLEAPAEPVMAELAEPPVVPGPVAVEPPPEVAQQRRQDWAERIRGEQRLPGALRDRLAAVVAEADADSDAEPQLSISQIAGVFAEALPTLLALETPRTVAPHPGGEAFFRAGQLSDDDAARIAREQLARTGFAQ